MNDGRHKFRNNAAPLHLSAIPKNAISFCMKKWAQLLTASLLLYLCGCDAHRSPTQSAEEILPPPAARLVSKQDVYVARHRGEEVFRIEARKWRDGRRGAIAITYDAPWGINEVFSLATDAAIIHGLRMDVEIVSSKLQHPKRFPIVARMRQELLPRGIGVFGHGHEHIDHDALSYDQAYGSFKLNFDLMEEWGLNPRAYAYPRNAGRLRRTQMANQRAGFICARGGTRNPGEYYLCPGGVREPNRWYNLPSVIMGKEGDIRDHKSLQPILRKTLELEAWVILMYHSIGYPDGWAYYPYMEFWKDLQFISREDFWSGNLDAVAAYIQERNALDIRIIPYFGDDVPREYIIIVGDGLDNAVFYEPLTLDFTFNSASNVQKVSIDPPIDGQTSFAVVDGKMRLHMIPDERQYSLILE